MIIMMIIIITIIIIMMMMIIMMLMMNIIRKCCFYRSLFCDLHADDHAQESYPGPEICCSLQSVSRVVEPSCSQLVEKAMKSLYKVGGAACANLT